MATTNLKIGSTGSEVKKLQQSLGIKADGIFGPQTQAAVKSFQASKGLVTDGIAGVKTQTALSTTAPKTSTSSASKVVSTPTLAIGAKGTSVSALQQQLNEQNAGKAGYVPLKVDGIYGPLTEAATRYTAPVAIDQKVGDIMGTTPPPPVAPTAPVKKVLAIPGFDPSYGKGIDDAIGYYKSEASKPFNESQIRNDTIKEFQAEIDATNSIFADKLKQARLLGNSRLGSEAAMQGRRGLLGSDFGNAAFEGKIALNQEGADLVNEEKVAKVSNIMSRANAAATTAIAARRAAKEAGTEAYVKYLKERGSQKELNAQAAANAIVMQGLTLEDIDPIQLKALADGYGITVDAIKAAIPDAELLKNKKEIEANKTTGTKTASIQEYEYAKANGYTGTYNQYQNEDANRKAIAQKIAGELSPTVASKVQAQSSAFESSPIVKNYNEVQNKQGSVGRIIDAGVGGPGDLALVFEFMKALDPTSVVRESEYASAAKSGNIFSGIFARFNGYFKEEGGFLPENVKQAFKELVNQKYQVATQQYQNLRNEKARVINKYTGGTDGADYLVDYSGGSDSAAPKGETKVINGVEYEKVDGGWRKTSFSSVGGDTNPASVKQAIANIESRGSGDYKAVSPVNTNGQRAYGKYQVLASNIPQWSKNALGREVSVQEFLASPDIQEKVVDHEIKRLLAIYSPDDVAAIWFSGKPLANNNRADVTGTSVPQYVTRFREELMSLA